MKAEKYSEHWEVEEFLTRLAEKETCQWCRHPREEIMPKTRLCSHCNRLKLNLKKIQAQADKMLKKRGGLTYVMDFELRVQQQMVASAKMEGQIYGDAASKEMMPLTLEHELCFLGKRYVHKEFFYGYANILRDLFCTNHARLLYYILSLFNREYLRRNRRRFATSHVMDEILKD